ncbi:hypothetical protein SAY87_014041 [Trapa incisa]|uniref:Uncharacterized protein n=1 Tax=Trapa incisa TaxID=236973 RepID=A0AAN7GJH3_9MYRT|nr:hypothetical protein SAY87_014041 [Trapa incisa]
MTLGGSHGFYNNEGGNERALVLASSKWLARGLGDYSLVATWSDLLSSQQLCCNYYNVQNNGLHYCWQQCSIHHPEGNNEGGSAGVSHMATRSTCSATCHIK